MQDVVRGRPLLTATCRCPRGVGDGLAADAGDYGPLGEVIARAVTNNLYKFVVPAVAGPARLVPLASLADNKAGIAVTALRAAAERGRLKAQKTLGGARLSSKNWVTDFQANKHKRTLQPDKP